MHILARIVISVSAMAAVGASNATAAPEPRPSDYGPFVARTVGEGIYLLAAPEDYLGPAVGNVTVIEQRDGMVLIDSGLARADGDRIVRYVKSLTSKPVKAVMITHWHNDHPQGVSQILAAWPKVRIIATQQTKDGIAGPAAATFAGFAPDPVKDAKNAEDMRAFVSQLRELEKKPENDEATRARYQRAIRENESRIADFAGTYLVVPNETFSRSLMLPDRDRPIQFRFLGRANTAGDAVAWLPKQRIVMTGDIVVAPTPFGFYSYPKDWIGVLQTIKAMKFRTLIPGHGDPQSDTLYLDKLIGTISDIRAQVGKLAAGGLSLDEVRKRVDFKVQTDIFGTNPRAKRLFDAFWITPMVENAYKEAKGQPIIQGGDEAKS